MQDTQEEWVVTEWLEGAEIARLVGKTLCAATYKSQGWARDEIIFETTEGERYILYYDPE
jgi:hypothetical protein